MRFGIMAILLAALAASPALAQPFDIKAGLDPETGDRVVSSVGNAEAKLRKGYSAAAESQVVMWVEIRLPETGPPHVYFVGQRLRYTLPRETQSRGRFGRGDPKDPAHVGSPFRAADLQTRWTEIICGSDAYYCSRIDEVEIALTTDMLEKFTSPGADKDIAIALTRKNRIDWRVPKAELVAVLEALKALAAEPAPS